MRQHLSEETIRSVLAATMASYQDLSDFEWGVIVGSRDRWGIVSPK